MITLAIVAILAAIAVPSYSEYVKRARITEAVAALADMHVKMERYFQDNRRYDPPAPRSRPAMRARSRRCRRHRPTSFSPAAVWA